MSSESSPGRGDLARLRTELERIDHALITLIAERLRIALAAGRAKRMSGDPVVDYAREAAVVRQAAGLARRMGLDEEEVRLIFWCLIDLSRRAQLEQT